VPDVAAQVLEPGDTALIAVLFLDLIDPAEPPATLMP
jgi:hypothetical protein